MPYGPRLRVATPVIIIKLESDTTTVLQGFPMSWAHLGEACGTPASAVRMRRDGTLAHLIKHDHTFPQSSIALGATLQCLQRLPPQGVTWGVVGKILPALHMDLKVAQRLGIGHGELKGEWDTDALALLLCALLDER